MKTVFLLLTFLFIARTSFADLRSILIEVETHRGGPSTVNVYSVVEAEQKTAVTLQEGSSVLKNAQGAFAMVWVYVLAEDTFTPSKDLLELLDGMKSNNEVQLRYLRVGPFSDSDKQLLAKFKVPDHTKAPTR